MTYHSSIVDTSIYLLNFFHTVIKSLLKKFLLNVFDNIFQKFYFSNKVWFWPDIFSWFLFGQPLPIFVVFNFFSKESTFENCLLLFYPRLNACLIPSSAKAPGWKISGRFPILRIKSRSTMIVKDWQIKICQGFCWGKISIDFREKK